MKFGQGWDIRDHGPAYNWIVSDGENLCSSEDLQNKIEIKTLTI